MIKIWSIIPTSLVMTDLQWWSTLDKQTAESPICPLQPVLVIESDASQLGWGARCMKTSMGGRWSSQEAIHHINYLELLAAFVALKTFASNQLLKDLILLRIDNVSAVTYINQKGGTHSTQLSNLALEIWEWCLQHQLTIQAEHQPGSLNWVADSESGTMKDRCDWMINPKVFQQICQSIGPLQIDLSASHLTNNYPATTVGDRTQKQKRRMPLLRTGPKQGDLPIPHGV